MCKISDKLKLCTCKTENVRRRKHYWILYRYQKSEVVSMGIPMLPQEFQIGKENDKYIHNKLEEMLNKGNCFDIDLFINNKDILELNFTHNPNSDKTGIHLVYEFVYKKNKWIANVHNPFNTDKLEKHRGKISNPFAKP